MGPSITTSRKMQPPSASRGPHSPGCLKGKAKSKWYLFNEFQGSRISRCFPRSHPSAWPQVPPSQRPLWGRSGGSLGTPGRGGISGCRNPTGRRPSDSWKTGVIFQAKDRQRQHRIHLRSLTSGPSAGRGHAGGSREPGGQPAAPRKH